MLQDFLKELIYSPQELADYIYTSVQGIILDCHFKEMLPDIRYMLDEDLVDTTVHVEYDDSVDYVFRYDFPRTLCEKPMRTDCLRHWAMFERESSGTDNPDEDVLKDLYKKLKEDIANTENVKKVKIGRNDPCPCGSGKKYKFCCMKKMNDASEAIETEAQRNHWLEDYPKTGGEKVEGRLYLDDYYDEESIAIDKLIYLALHYRAVPIWNREEPSVIEKRKKWYLGQALDKFTDKMAKEGFSSLKEYDEKCSIHYTCREWMGAYQELLAGETGSDHARLLKEWCQ